MNDVIRTRLISLLPTTCRFIIEQCIVVENCEKPQNSEEAAENVDNGYFGAVVHLDCVDLEACKKWVSEFSDSSLCTWRVRRTYPGGRRGLVCRMDYVCHHSRFNKLHEKRQKTKDTDCRATLTIKVRERNKSNMNDAYMKQDLPCVVSLSWTHNHALNTASALLYRPSGLELKEQFFEYFDEGMTAATSIVYHEHALKLLEDFREEDLADGKKNPLQRTVHYWHDEWRKKQRGGKTELSLVEQLEEKIPIWLDTCGATVAVQELPFAVVIITPIMRRVHSTSFARDMCFVYSTTSNAADNNVITFMMVPTAAGAVPGAVLVTDSAVEATYVDAFKLLQSELQDSSFGGQCYPQSFITDDCPAKRAALAVCWPQSDLKLSVFHVSQAVWQWIWAEEQKIAKEDRPVLMSEFRRIIYSCSEGDTATAFNEAFHSPTAVRYEHYQDYLKDWWELRELWCLTYRSEHPKGRQVNNFAEVTARLYKDILNRSKACNVVALVDFTVHVMEEYYRCRLRDFANGRMPTHRLMIEKLSERSSYLRSRDQISDLGEGKFEVPSSDFTELYSVDANLGCCTCVFGLSGQFCEHQYAVMRLFKTAFSNVPSLDAASRYSIAKIALGPNCPPLSFYGGISDQSSSAVEMSCDGAHEGNASQDDVYETDCKQEATAAAESGSSMESLLAEYNNLIALNCARFADDLACWAALSKAVARLRTVSTSQSFAAFLHNAGVSRRNAPAAQPVSLARDAEASRGAKRSATCHRPSAGSGSCRTKRQRCPSAKRRS